MAKIVKLTESDLKKMVFEAFNEYGGELRHIDTTPKYNDRMTTNASGGPGGEAIRKWVYWCYNFHNPEEWMDIFEGAPREHFMEKFDNYYKRYGSEGVMTRFFLALDKNNQEILADYVMNNYNG